ncbi:MAG: hypothetical protein MH204_12640, partial [Fimbriimonadaceae bacterium]|nr:hypothetical protein [Fimbriimonadaceae bacterium]
IFTALTIFIAGAGAWIRGSEMIDAETNSKQAVRVISDQLRQAMMVTVDNNGQGLTYRIPTRTSDGTFSAPPVWDNVSRRIFLQNGNIVLQEGTATRTIVRGVITTDPENGNASYQIFTPGAGSIVRDVTVFVVTRRNLSQGRTVSGRKREVVYLRNIPRITQ